MKKKRNKKIHKDKKGCEFIKDSYFIGGKRKFHRIYVIDGMPADEFYEKNATDLDFFVNEDFWLMNCEKESNNSEQENEAGDLFEGKDDLPF